MKEIFLELLYQVALFWKCRCGARAVIRTPIKYCAGARCALDRNLRQTYRVGSCSSELQLKVNCRKNFGLVYQLLAMSAQILSSKSSLIYEECLPSRPTVTKKYIARDSDWHMSYCLHLQAMSVFSTTWVQYNKRQFLDNKSLARRLLDRHSSRYSTSVTICFLDNRNR